MTNRPTYAPERRPGDPMDLEQAARELVTLHVALRDVNTIAAALHAGADALSYADRLRVGLVTINTIRRDVELAHAVADCLTTEAQRVHDRNEARHVEIAKAQAKAERASKKARTIPTAPASLDPMRAAATISNPI